MKTAAIIAEYNPFHTGHEFQINQIRKQLNPDYIIVLLSGDFVQRGAPAIFDKYTRTTLALASGVDAVFELPTVHAVHSAEYFAHAGVCLLNKLNCIDYLCFGAETGNLEDLSCIADIFCREPENFRIALKKHLSSGLSYPSARSLALTEYLESAKKTLSEKADVILSTPNNILAIEYLKSLQQYNSKIQPFLIRRTENNYHDTAVSKTFSSATALRSLLLNKNNTYENYMPSTALSYLKENNMINRTISSTHFDSLFHYLFANPCLDPAEYIDINDDLANRMKKSYCAHDSIPEFAQKVKSKNYPFTRITRGIMHILLQMKKEDFPYFAKETNLFYISLLGFQKSSSSLIKYIKKHSSLCLLQNEKNNYGHLPSEQISLINKDIFAHKLYQSVYYDHYKEELPNSKMHAIIYEEK